MVHALLMPLNHLNGLAEACEYFVPVGHWSACQSDTLPGVGAISRPGLPINGSGMTGVNRRRDYVAASCSGAVSSTHYRFGYSDLVWSGARPAIESFRWSKAIRWHMSGVESDLSSPLPFSSPSGLHRHCYDITVHGVGSTSGVFAIFHWAPAA